MTQKCYSCQREFDLVMFDKDLSRKSGRSPRCKFCRTLYQKAQRDKIRAAHLVAAEREAFEAEMTRLEEWYGPPPENS